MEPLVSVIIPVYNVAPYLRESLDSVINQTYKNFEMIIVDDGSTDDSEVVCDQYKELDKRIQVIHRKNGGLSAARNTGLDAMHGNIVAFLDPDDAFMPEMIEVMVRNMKRSQADLVVCGFYKYNTTKRMRGADSQYSLSLKNKALDRKKALTYLFEEKLNYTIWNKIYARHLFDGMRFPEGRVFEDKQLLPLLIKKANKILVLPEILMKYRIRPDSISRTYSEKNSLDWLYADNMELAFITDHCPSLFSYRQKEQFLEYRLKRTIHYYLGLAYNDLKKCYVPPKVKKAYKAEIKARGRSILRYSLKTRVLYLSFVISPYLCYLLYNLYRVLICCYNKTKTTIKTLRNKNGRIKN